MPEKDKKLIQRWGHSAAAVTVNSDCVEVVLFGGFNKDLSVMADTVVVRLGECLMLNFKKSFHNVFSSLE